MPRTERAEIDSPPSPPPSSPSRVSNPDVDDGSESLADLTRRLYAEGRDHAEVKEALRQALQRRRDREETNRRAAAVLAEASMAEANSEFLEEARRRAAEQERVAALLTEVAFDSASRMVETYGADLCEGWFRATIFKLWRGETLRNPAGFIHSKLKNRDQAPKLSEKQIAAALTWWQSVGKDSWWSGTGSSVGCR